MQMQGLWLTEANIASVSAGILRGHLKGVLLFEVCLSVEDVESPQCGLELLCVGASESLMRTKLELCPVSPLISLLSEDFEENLLAALE